MDYNLLNADGVKNVRALAYDQWHYQTITGHIKASDTDFSAWLEKWQVVALYTWWADVWLWTKYNDATWADWAEIAKWILAEEVSLEEIQNPKDNVWDDQAPTVRIVIDIKGTFIKDNLIDWDANAQTDLNAQDTWETIVI